MNVKIRDNFHRSELLAKAREVTEAAKSEGRDLTSSEVSEVDAILTAVKAWDDAQAESAKAFDAWLATTAPSGREVYDLGDGEGGLFSDSVKAGFVNAARTKSSYGATVQIKAPITGGTLLPESGTLVSPQPLGAAMFGLRDLFAKVEASGPNVRYYRMGAGTAAVVAEGALKPDAGVAATAVDGALLKIAATFQISDELAEDAPFLISAIQTEVLRAVAAKENAEIVTALSGASGVQTSTGAATATIDLVAAAIGAHEALNGTTPDAILMNPTNVATVRQAKASTGGSYFVDPIAAAPSTLHGVRLVSTTSVAAGTVLLVGKGAAVVYTRGGVRVEAGYNSDDWSKNLMTVRVEERVLPAVIRPGLVHEITLT